MTPETMKIRFGLRTFNVSSERLCPIRPVFRLDIRYTLLEKALRLLITSVLPQQVVQRIQLWIPWLFLPPKVIIKQEKPQYEKYFEAEKQAYLSLSPYWGSLLPHYYGEADCVDQKSRAHVISEAKGTQLTKIKKQNYDSAFLMLKHTYEVISEYGIIHGRPFPEHAFIYENGAMLIDWDEAEVEENFGEAKTINMIDHMDMQRMMGKKVNI